MQNEFRNWSDIRVFLAVFREGSTLAASRKLGVAQPTVARRIDALENETGLTLFERDTRGFKPTDHARDLYPLAQAMETRADSLAMKTRELAQPKPVHITSPSHFSDATMDILSAFAASHPDIVIKFVHGTRVHDLFAGEADIAFRVSNSTPEPDLVCRKIGIDHFTLYGTQSYVDNFGLPASLDDLEGHKFVTFRDRETSASQHDWLMKYVSTDQIVQTLSELDLMYAAIKAGHGLGLIHTRWADSQGTFIRCFDDIEELSMTMTMLIAPDAYRRPEVKAFSKFFAPRYAATFT
ncbi:MAG: LysR family transcriptional regulator [Paracoccaceae bacterium]